jgi:long-chain acyl-CoA synthetase
VPNLEAIGASGNRRIEDVLRVALGERGRGLASYQRLAGYAISREALPRTRLGKYQRFKLPALYAALRAGARPASTSTMSEADRALLAASPGAEIWAWLKTRYPDQALSLDLSPQLDLGVDSLEWVTMTLELAERFGVHFSEEDGGAIATLRDLLVLAGERRERKAVAVVDLAWLARRGPTTRKVGHALHAVNRALVRGAFGLDVAGIGNLPRDGGCILAVNHLSDLDPFVVASAVEHSLLDRAWWSGDRDRLFGTRLGRALAHAAHIFPIDERQPAISLAYGVEVLRRGLMLVWFPESWRSPDGALQRFLPGIGQLVLTTGARVVPARLHGTFEAMPRGTRWPKRLRLGLSIGEPIEADALRVKGDAAAIAEAVRAAVAALADPRGQPPSRLRR